MNSGRLIRTVRHLKLRQIWYQVWRRIQRGLEAHPKCGCEELPEFTFLNLAAKPKGWNDESLDMLWRYNLHYFDWVLTQRRRDAEYAENLLERWIKDNPKGCVPGWDPYPTSLRIVNWVKYLQTHSAHSASLRLCVENSLRAQLDYLAKHIEWHILANHLLANLKALVIGNRFLGRDCDKWMRIYKKQISEQVLPDGGHYERSVMYHAIILEDVLDVIKFCGEDAAWLRPVAEKMLRFLVNMTGPDGKIAMFNDAADGIAKPTGWLVDYAKELGLEAPVAEPFADFSDAGYTRMTAGDFVLFADIAPIGPDYQPGHAHADTLTYELYYKGRKIVTDVGTSEYRGKRRAYERSTAAHNVVEIDGRNSSEVWSSHRVGARARIVKREVEQGRIFAAHDGYGFEVGREWRLTNEGLAVTEHVNGSGNCVTRVYMTLAAKDAKSEKEESYFEIPGIKVNGLDNFEDYEYAVEFGKLEKGMCLSGAFNGGEFTYSILPTV